MNKLSHGIASNRVNKHIVRTESVKTNLNRGFQSDVESEFNRPGLFPERIAPVGIGIGDRRRVEAVWKTRLRMVSQGENSTRREIALRTDFISFQGTFPFGDRSLIRLGRYRGRVILGDCSLRNFFPGN